MSGGSKIVLYKRKKESSQQSPPLGAGKLQWPPSQTLSHMITLCERIFIEPDPPVVIGRYCDKWHVINTPSSLPHVRGLVYYNIDKIRSYDLWGGAHEPEAIRVFSTSGSARFGHTCFFFSGLAFFLLYVFYIFLLFLIYIEDSPLSQPCCCHLHPLLSTCSWTFFLCGGADIVR